MATLRYFHKSPKPADVVTVNTVDTSSITATLDTKADKYPGRGFSLHNYSTNEKNKLSGIEDGAEVNVQSDWNESDDTSDAYIKNKPSVPVLDLSGQIPARYLPSYVDDVLEYPSISLFPDPGETGKIYVDVSTDLTYRWSGSTYVEISKSILTGVKGDAENAYRVGNVNITPTHIGLGNVVNIDQSKAIKNITRDGTTFTYTCLDGTTGTFTLQDNNTTYSAGTGLSLNGTTFSLALTKALITTALGYTPANESSLSGYLPTTGANYNTQTDANPFIISRLGNTAEAIAVKVNDQRTLFEYTNDERSSAINFTLINTDTENSNGTYASERTMSLSSGHSGMTLSLDGEQVATKTWVHSNYLPLSGGTISGALTLSQNAGGILTADSQGIYILKGNHWLRATANGCDCDGSAIITSNNIGTILDDYLPISSATFKNLYSSYSNWGWQFNNNNGGSVHSQIYMAHAGGYGMHIRGYSTANNIYLLQLYNASEHVMSIYSDKHAVFEGAVSMNSTLSVGGAASVGGGLTSKQPNDFIHSSDEFTFVPSGFSGGVYFNYRTAGGTNGNITEYHLGNGKGGTLGSIIHSGNIGSQSVSYATSAGSAPASDVYSWAKASTKPSYSWSEITSKPSIPSGTQIVLEGTNPDDFGNMNTIFTVGDDMYINVLKSSSGVAYLWRFSADGYMYVRKRRDWVNWNNWVTMQNLQPI